MAKRQKRLSDYVASSMVFAYGLGYFSAPLALIPPQAPPPAAGKKRPPKPAKKKRP
jgi:hypothetical protein